MKTYLNQEELSQLLFINCLANEIEFLMRGWKSRDNLTVAEEEKLIELVKTCDAALSMILSRFGSEQRAKLERRAQTTMVMLRPRMSGAEMRRLMEKEAEENNIEGAFCSTSTAECLANYALSGHCHPCKLEPHERKSCPARQAYLELGIPMCDEYATGDACPYDNGEVVKPDADVQS